MKRFIRGMAVATAVIAPAIISIAPSAQAASAQADVFTQSGSGTISPGLNVTPATQSFNFSGTGTGVGTGGVASPAACNAAGTDQLGTVAEGEGTANINCTIGSDSASVSAVFVRVGTDVTVAITPSTSPVSFGGGKCQFVPDQTTPPVTSYKLTCGGGSISA